MAWNNGQSGNTGTDTAAECSTPPYATHDWIADHALALLPDEEKAWLEPHRAAILSALDMDSMQSNRSDPAFLASVGASLNIGVNELADVLHSFFLSVVAEDDGN